MSVIGKKLNPIQASGGHGDENTVPANNQTSKITPDDVLRLTTITDDYLCSSGAGKTFILTLYQNRKKEKPTNRK